MKTRIRSLREDNDLTQKQVSNFLNVSQVAYYEISKREIPLDSLSRIADFYGTSTDYLLYRTDEFTPYTKSKLSKKEIIKV